MGAQDWTALEAVRVLNTTCVIGDVATIQSLECIFANVLAVVVPLLGLLAFILLLMSGFKYLTSGGDPKAIQSAKLGITFSILGLALIIGSWLILKLVGEFTGVSDILKLQIPGP
ncbi:MAG: hypothetical protein Q8N81_01965 [bacterium]|nr:hypothetical protein [bacterium]